MIESVISQVYGVLDKYSKDYNDAAVTDNLTRWKNNKSWLIELLRCHSNWNEDALAIVFDVTLSREIDSHTVVSHKNDLFNLIMELDITKEERNNFYTALNIAVNSYTKTLSSDDAVASIKQYSGVSVAVGQKTSRIINKICQRYGLDKHSEYNAHFARLADSLNPLKVRRKALLSVHPCDYLEMSNRINSWNSCHCLSDGGYHAGTLSYMNDECSMIFYTVDDDAEGDYFKAPKRSRQVFCFNSGILLQSRLYPNTDDEESRNTYRNIVQQAIADCLKLPNLWTLKRNRDEIDNRIQTYDGSLHYPDYNYSCNKANISLLKDASVGEDDYIIIGHTAYCLNCSQPISETDTLYCDYCGDSDYYTCTECGSRVHEDDIHYINGSYYCDGCCSYCEHCQQYTLEELICVHDRRGYLLSVCNSCRTEEYYYCEDCEEYYHVDNGISLDDGFHCDDCISNNYYECETCGEYIHHSDIVEAAGGYYCNSCFEGVEAEENEQVNILVSM